MKGAVAALRLGNPVRGLPHGTRDASAHVHYTYESVDVL